MCSSDLVKQIASGNLLCDAGSSNLVLCDYLEGWDGVGTGLGSLSLLQGIFPTQGLNPRPEGRDGP